MGPLGGPATMDGCSLGVARPLRNRMVWEHQHTKVVPAAIIAFQ